MGVLQRFERRLGGLVEGAFAKVFKGGVEPVELAGALTRECDDQRQVGPSRVLVPNHFVISLASPDHERLGPYAEPLGEELAAIVREHAAAQRYTFAGPVVVQLAHDPELPMGLHRIHSSVAPAGGSRVTGGGPPARRGRRRTAWLVVTTNGVAPAGSVQAVGAQVEVSLDRDVVSIGRGSDVDVQLPDTGVSRRHGEILAAGDGSHVYRDLASTNGSRINGRRVAEAGLVDGDRIEIGSSVLVYRHPDGGPRAGGGRQGGEWSGPPYEA